MNPHIFYIVVLMLWFDVLGLLVIGAVELPLRVEGLVMFLEAL